MTNWNAAKELNKWMESDEFDDDIDEYITEILATDLKVYQYLYSVKFQNEFNEIKEHLIIHQTISDDHMVYYDGVDELMQMFNRVSESVFMLGKINNSIYQDEKCSFDNINVDYEGIHFFEMYGQGTFTSATIIN
jgi:hypothetical protein